MSHCFYFFEEVTLFLLNQEIKEKSYKYNLKRMNVLEFFFICRPNPKCKNTPFDLG